MQHKLKDKTDVIFLLSTNHIKTLTIISVSLNTSNFPTLCVPMCTSPFLPTEDVNQITDVLLYF